MLPPSAPATVPPTQPRYCTEVEPKRSQRSNVPSPRPAIPHEASTIACPCAARRSGPPGSDGPIATPIGRKREFTSAAASTAAATVPPCDRIAIAVNCADPANTIADIAIAAPADSPAPCATTPNESASSPLATANGSPARSPSRRRSRRTLGCASSIMRRVPGRAGGTHDDRGDQPSGRLMERPGSAPSSRRLEVRVLPAAVLQAHVDARRDDLVDAVEDRPGERHVRGAELGLEVAHRPRSDDRGRDRRMVDHERERELDQRHPRLLGELRERLGGVELALVGGNREVVSAGKPVGARRLRRLLALAPPPGQPAAGERPPRDR